MDVRRDCVNFAHCVTGRTVCRGRRDAQERRVSVLHSVSLDERYIAIEHMDVRRDCVNIARCLTQEAQERPVSTLHSVSYSAWEPR